MRKQFQENGILTSDELATIDLTETKLVVLSACDSKLGENAGNEGLCSLEKAVISTGANSVISSLWKIDDDFTSIFMEEFYSNWTKSSNLNDAFRETQLHFIAGGSPYSSPFYWGAFVLLFN
ncbi:MAG: CHAT domain-containing protein [Bacteroidetes bacterium]|nr:CHAT domain-containing protein [Bacteroidota bacterium]